MIISIHVEKAFNVQHVFMIKNTRKLGIEGKVLKMITNIYKRPITDIMLNCERMNTFSLRPRKRQGYPLTPLLSNIILNVLISAIRKYINGIIGIGKGEIISSICR